MLLLNNCLVFAKVVLLQRKLESRFSSHRKSLTIGGGKESRYLRVRPGCRKECSNFRDRAETKGVLNTVLIELELLRKRLQVVKQRDEPITIREAMRALEGYICLEAAEYKNQYFNLDWAAERNALILFKQCTHRA